MGRHFRPDFQPVIKGKPASEILLCAASALLLPPLWKCKGEVRAPPARKTVTEAAKGTSAVSFLLVAHTGRGEKSPFPTSWWHTKGGRKDTHQLPVLMGLTSARNTRRQTPQLGREDPKKRTEHWVWKRIVRGGTQEESAIYTSTYMHATCMAQM
ncbi:hypothetical protein KIL84_007370 [Mauremys mutica]|uniref:Uncharacterized protein n=1 Tax=Mauremys mutica TaxID=74926 RepID=A0A9D3X2W5_9SAUR|nr:hypothetical protein KIL84_007370 [Mauremys mutica]